jgi:hypothetical protein
LGSDHVDALIAQWDEDEGGISHVVLKDCSFSPFSMLRIELAPTEILPREDLPTVVLHGSPSWPLALSTSPFTSKLNPALSPAMPENGAAAFLFHHYVNHIAPLMMPFEDARNPWKYMYPAVALEYNSKEQKCLYRGMQAQAAFHLAQLRCDSDKMQALGTNRYVFAMEQLRESIAEESKDYSTFLAAAITLMMVEVMSSFSTAVIMLMLYSGLQR